MNWQAALLRDNFQEIANATHGNLVANLSGRRIYDSTRGWGRLWVWFYSFVDFVMHGGIRLDRLKKALVTTHILFQRQLSLIRKHVAAYESYLKQAGNGYAIYEDSVHESRKAIEFWNRAYAPCLKRMQQVRSSKLEKLLRIIFKGRMRDTTPAALWASPDAMQLKACQHVIDVEGLSSGPLPLEIFKKILKEKPLNSIDSKQLKRWISKINKVPHCISQVHGMVQALTERFAKGEVALKHLRCVVLESFLEDNGCSVFQQQDPRQLRWQDKLKVGRSLNEGGAEFVLGKELISADAGADNTRVFNLEKPDGQVLVTAQNKAALAIRSFRRKPGTDVTIEPAQLLGVYGNGRWAVMERLHSLGSHVWTSGLEGISEEDAPLVNALALLLGGLVKNNCTPSGFSAKEILFDNQGCLKSLKTMKTQSFDFNALEDFVRECSRSNQTIFQHLMSFSGLSEHPIANFYYELIANAFKGDETPVADLAGMYKVSDPKVVDRGTELVREALALRSQLIMKIRVRRHDVDIKAIRGHINSTILSCYHAARSCGFLWPTLAQEVFQKFSN